MPAFQNASKSDIRYLLELFPIANLRAAWKGGKKNKEQFCAEVAATRSKKEITEFIAENIYSCKQHVHIFSLGEDKTITFPEEILGGERILHAANVSALYIVKVRHKVILSDPLDDDYIDFLWPILIEILPEHLLVRIVSLEKDLQSHFQRPCIVRSRSVAESGVLSALKGLHQGPVDLHKGIKKLWENGFMDATRTKYKKPHSQASETMDEALGIRTFYPELYETLKLSTLFSTLFVIDPKAKCGVSAMSATPLNGFLTFPRYADATNGTGYVVEQILQHNK